MMHKSIFEIKTLIFEIKTQTGQVTASISQEIKKPLLCKEMNIEEWGEGTYIGHEMIHGLHDKTLQADVYKIKEFHIGDMTFRNCMIDCLPNKEQEVQLWLPKDMFKKCDISIRSWENTIFFKTNQLTYDVTVTEGGNVCYNMASDRRLPDEESDEKLKTINLFMAACDISFGDAKEIYMSPMFYTKDKNRLEITSEMADSLENYVGCKTRFWEYEGKKALIIRFKENDHYVMIYSNKEATFFYSNGAAQKFVECIAYFVTQIFRAEAIGDDSVIYDFNEYLAMSMEAKKKINLRLLKRRYKYLDDFETFLS